MQKKVQYENNFNIFSVFFQPLLGFRHLPLLRIHFKNSNPKNKNSNAYKEKESINYCND